MREYIVEDLGIPRQGNRPLICLILSVWEAVKKRVAARPTDEAKQRV